MPRDPFIREKFIREHTAARKLAKEYFERYPKDRYQTEVESWRNLQSSNIEFTMKRLREPKPPSARCAKTAAGFAKPIPVDHGKASTPAPAAPPELLVRAVTRVTLIQHRGCRRALRPNLTRRAGAIDDRQWLETTLRRSDSPARRPPARHPTRCRQVHTDLPKADQQLDEWQTAIEALIMAAEGRGPLMHARIGMMRALNRHVECSILIAKTSSGESAS